MGHGKVMEYTRLLKLCLFLILPIPCFAASQSIVVPQFSGLDTQDNPSSLQPSQSQDLLNVRLQPGGKAVYKRDGYGLFQALPSFSTAPVHGGYHFQQSGGADVQLWGSDTGLYASVNDSAFVRVASGTVGSTWQCTDNLGFAYCVTSSGVDVPVKTDGSAANTSYVGTIPSGTIVASTPLQLVIAGVSGNASTIYVSSNNGFAFFGSGPLPTDPYTEIINASGSRITHLAYYFGNIYWWKDQSFGYISGSASQGTVGVTIISNQIGTLDNSSAFWNPTTYDTGNRFNTGAGPTSTGNPYFNEMQQLGGIFFRGQDNHIYQYDGYNLTRISRIITPNVTASGRRKVNSWTQSAQADFQSGSIVPTHNLSTVISPGDVIVSSFQAIENSATQWTTGFSNNVTINPTQISLSTNAAELSNNSFETCVAGSSPTVNWTDQFLPGFKEVICRNSFTTGSCVTSPEDGSFMVQVLGNPTMAQVVLANSTTTVINSISITYGNCSWTANTLSVPSIYIGQKIQLVFTTPIGANNNGLISDPFLPNGNSIVFYAQFGQNGGTVNKFIDFVTGMPRTTMTSGFFTSQIYNTGFTSSTYQLQSSFTVNTATPTFSLLTSTSPTGVFSTILNSTGTNAHGNQYVEYIASFTIGANDLPLSAVTSVTILSRSTGTYYSAVDNAPNLSSWGSFTADDVYPGISSITYYTRSSTVPFTVLSATPSWISQTKNSSVVASTGTYMQMRGDFFLSAATETPTLNDFTFNWFEGTAADKAYIQYFQDAIWFSVSSGSGTSSNNTVFYLDLLNSTWLKDNIAANGFAVENNTLYLGDPLSSNVYKFGGVTTDNSNSIRSYWKSMDFTGSDPTTQNEFVQSDFSFAESSTTVSYTYDIDQSTSTMLTVVNLPLYSNTSSIIKRGLLLGVGKIGTYYNFTVGDNSSLQKWTLMGHRVKYNALNWVTQTAN